MQLAAIGLWLLAVAAIGLVSLPLAGWLAPRNAAPAVAVTVGLAVVGIVGHLVGQVAFGLVAFGAGFIALVGLSALAMRRGYTVERSRFVEAALVFVAAFAFVLVIRGVDPSAGVLPYWRGEKFLDFGLLSSLDRAGTLPPQDVWFAGEPVRYYYGGHMLTALIAAATGLPPALAYNLGLATFYAALVSTAWGLAGAIASHVGASRRRGAALGAVFVGLAATLETTVRLLVWLLPDGPARALVDAAGMDASALSWTPDAFNLFDATRVIPVDPGAADPFRAATEFPLFAWLNGDHHAHMLSQPFTLLVVVALFAYWVTPATRRRRRLLLLGGVVGPLAGLIGLINLWSFPTIAGLTAVFVYFAPASPTSLIEPSILDRFIPAEGWMDEVSRLAGALVAAAGVAIVGVLVTLPFWIDVVVGGPPTSVRPWGESTPIGPFLVVHGGFLLVFGVALSRWGWVTLERGRFLAAGVGLALAVGWLLGVPVLALLGSIGLVTWYGLVRDRGTGELSVGAALLMAGAGILLIIEVVTVAGERFNTIFKASAHVWLVWSIAAAVFLARVSDGWPMVEADRVRLARRGRVLAIVVLVITGSFAVLAVPGHFGDDHVVDEPTLNATAYLEEAYPEEAPAIRWLNDRSGQPTIVTAVPAGYWWRPAQGEGAAAPATLSGLPTVLGWHHERQYRGDAPFERRFADVQAIYTGNFSTQRALLAQYDVEYIYVGPAERQQFPALTIRHLPDLEVAAEFEAVTIYRVTEAALDS